MRREYVGAAQKAYTTALLGGALTDLTIVGDNLADWPTGAGGRPFYVVIDRNTVSEEKILCASRTGNTITVYNSGGVNGRGADGTTRTAHGINAELEHVFTATDADEANAHVNANSGVHGLTGSVVGTTDTQTVSNKTLNNTTFTGTVNGLDIPFNPFFLMGA